MKGTRVGGHRGLANQTIYYLIVSAIMMCLSVAVCYGTASNDVSVTKEVTPGDHTIDIPPVPDGSETAEIRVTITTNTNEWRIVEFHPGPEGWLGTYVYDYDGTDPGSAYDVAFSGRLERVSAPITAGGGGGDTNDTFRVDGNRSSIEPLYYILPPQHTVCAGQSATFTAYKNENDPEPAVPADSFWTVDSDTNYPVASSVVITNTTTGVYAVVAQNSPTRALSDTANLTVLRVDIQQTNVYYFAMSTNLVTFNLTNSYLGNGTVHWTGGPANEFLGSGDPLAFTVPTNWPAGEHTITAYSDLLTNCLDTAKLTIIKVDINIRTDCERTSNMPAGFNTAYLYDPTEDEWGWGNPCFKELGFFTDPHGDSRGHMEGKGSITPAGIDTSAMEFRWRQKVLVEVVWVSPSSSETPLPGPDNPEGIWVDNLPNWNSAETELCIFMRDDPGGPFPGTITTASLQYRRRINFESWVEIRFTGGTWEVCSDKKKWYIRYAFTVTVHGVFP